MAGEQFQNPTVPSETDAKCAYQIRSIIGVQVQNAQAACKQLKDCYEQIGTANLTAATSEADKDEIRTAYAAIKTMITSIDSSATVDDLPA